ncbi:MAG: histone deacetylase [Saprospiraceae bacterium]|jgi:acetoin utilization deacetylase AcuC-like enzyme|nr:histone deacetylase [Saprospiraceae bacterium]
MLKIAWSPIYRYDLPEGHRFPMSKYDLLPEQLIYEGTAENENFFNPGILTDEMILLTHTESYLTKLNGLTLNQKEIRNIGFPMSEQLITRGKHISNGTWMCAQFAMEYGISMNIAGGTHHAYADKGEGFCIFNDIAISSNLLIANHLCNNIMIIDLDVHQGNGTAKIFEHDPKVFTFSMHGERNYPSRKENSSLDIGLPDGTDDNQYIKTLGNILPRLIEENKPDFIFYLAGVDVLATDKLGRLGLSKRGAMERDKLVVKIAKENKIPTAISMGGGYSPKLSDIIDAHANTFRVVQEVFF